MNGLLELLTNKHWMIHPDFVSAARPMIQQNLNGHMAFVAEKKVMATAIPVVNGEHPADIFQDSRISVINGRPVYSWDDEHKDDPFINLMYVDGPITRNGGACTYGSVELRDIMMRAADDQHCVGHIFFINTPGGSAWAKNDFQQAIDYAHERKQPVNAFIDGMCCSAGMYLASMCDERYYMHPKDQIGCIGVMAAFYTEADGSKCEYTNETYHELYDPESFDKNKEMRDIANDGNSDLLIEELTQLGIEFRADIVKACPKAKDEHLHGKVFDAQDVKGILMDGQMSLSEVFDRTVKMAKRSGNPAIAATQATHTTYTVKTGGAASVTMQAGAAKENIFSPTNNSINMKEKFPALFAALQVEEMQMQDGGAFMNEGLLATLNEKIEAMQKAEADAKALVESLTAEKNDLTAKVEELNADIEAKNLEVATLTENAGKADEQLKAKDEEIATLKADAELKQTALAALEQEKADMTAAAAEKDETIATLQSDVEGKQAQIEQLQADVDGARASLTTAEQTLAERDQQITDLNAQITELQNNPGAEPAAGAAPQNNGGGADAPSAVVNRYVWNRELSAEENWKLEEQWNKEHGIEK